MINLLGDKFRPYIEFLRLIASYHHGVFWLPMVTDEAQRRNLFEWLLRHPKMSRRFQGAERDVVLFVLTKEFYKEFECEGTPTTGRSFENAMDLCLFNSFIYEKKIEEFYVNLPLVTINFEKKLVGVGSRRWGINPKLGPEDILLMTKFHREECLANLGLQFKFYNGPLKKDELRVLLENSYTPKALRNLKFKWRS